LTGVTGQDGAVAGPAWVHANVAQEIRFGAGSADQLPELLRELGIRRALLVTSAGRRASEHGESLARRLGRSLTSTFAEVVPHLPADTVRAAFEQARADGVDGVISFGGGSVVDCGKAISFFIEQQAGTPGRTVLDRPAILHVAIPTTYSAGVLGGLFTMTDTHTRTKATAGSPTTAPTAVVYDPGLVADLDETTIAGTAFDALAAAIEGAQMPARSPETEALAFAASRRIVGVLPLVIDTPDDLVVRADLMEGSVLAARVLQHTGPGPVHALAQLLGGRTGAPHGASVSCLLGPVARWQARGDPVAFARLAEALGADETSLVVAELRERVGLPDGLRGLGVSLDDIDAVARLSQAHPAMRRTRPPLHEADVRDLLVDAL
jgi:maleylacetate reductase